jgi:hypothetical protein
VPRLAVLLAGVSQPDDDLVDLVFLTLEFAVRGASKTR